MEDPGGRKTSTLPRAAVMLKRMKVLPPTRAKKPVTLLKMTSESVVCRQNCEHFLGLVNIVLPRGRLKVINQKTKKAINSH
jgi:hypothetical protein